MKRLAFSLALFLPSLVFATAYTCTNDGAFSDTHIWSPVGTPGLSDRMLITGHTVTQAVNIITGGLSINNGTLLSGAGYILFVDTANLFGTNSFIGATGAGQPINLPNYWLSGCLISNFTVIGVYGKTNDLGSLFSQLNPDTTRTISLYTATNYSFVANSTNVNYRSITPNAWGVSILFSNSSIILRSLGIGNAIQNVTIALVNSTVTLTGAGSDQPFSQYSNSGNLRHFLTNSAILLTNSSANPSTFAAPNYWYMASSVVTGANGASWQLNYSQFTMDSASKFYIQAGNANLQAIGATGLSLTTSNTANGIWTLVAASTIDYLNNFGTVNMGSLSFSASAITNNGTLLGSNCPAITCSNFINIGASAKFSNQTSTVLLAGNSNVTNFWNLQPNSPNVSLTNASVTIYGTLTGAAGASLNGTGATIILSNQPGFLYGTLSNATVNGLPLTATTTRNAGGRLNDLMRRGQE